MKTFTLPRKSLKTIVWLLSILWTKNKTVHLSLMALLFFTLLTIVANIVTPLLFKKIIDLLISPEKNNIIFIQCMVISYGLIWALHQIIAQLMCIITFRLTERGIRSLNLSIFEHLQSLSMRFHTEKRTGAITSAIHQAQSGFDAIIYGLCISIVPIIIEMFIVIMIFNHFYGIQYSGILFVTMIGHFSFSLIGMHFFDEAQERYNQKKTLASGIFVDSLLNIETMKYFHNQKYDYEKYDAILQQQESAGIKLLTIDSLMQCGQKVIISSGLALLTWKSGNAVLNGVLSTGDFVLINSYLLQFIMPLSSFGYIMRQVKKGLNDFGEVINLLKIEPEIKDAPEATHLTTQVVSIVFNNVNFSYNTQRSILKDISFCIPPGKTVALVGPTGAGKSTITRLLFRLYDVTSGAILCNNQDIRMFTQQSLHEKIGVISQETNLFNDTLYYNIAYGRPTASRDEVEVVIKQAQLYDFIKKLPDGYNTLIGERGLKLSGGEKQRVALARVLLKQPSLYIFDEATSSLDTVTEREIQEKLKEIAQERTTLIIAHRLSTITHADEIIVLEDGMIVERGNHLDLLALNGLYSRLWNSQKNITNR